MSTKRLLFLESLTQKGSTDPLAWYGLAMEYKGLARTDDALGAFRTLREKHPDYVAMYLMCSGMLGDAGRKEEAREWLEAGIAAAKAKGDAHALGELTSSLANL